MIKSMQNMTVCRSLSSPSSSSRRLYLLAAALSISPSQLVRYTNELKRRGVHYGDQNNSQGNLNDLDDAAQQISSDPVLVDIISHSDQDSYTTSSCKDVNTTEKKEQTSEFPLLLHAILCAVLLPFSNMEDVRGSSSALLRTTTATTTGLTETFVKEDEAKRLLQKKNSVMGRATPTLDNSPSSFKETALLRPSQTNIKKHFASLKGVVVSHHSTTSGFVSAPTKHETRRASAASCGNSRSNGNSGSSSTSTSGSSDNDTNSSDVSSLLSDVKEEEEGGALARREGPSHSRRQSYSSLKLPSSQPNVSTMQLLAKLAEPILADGTHIFGVDKINGNVNKNNKQVETKMNEQQHLQPLPKELHTPAGVARLSKLYPPFLPLLLEALLKEGTNGNTSGLAARRAFVRLTELSAPIFVEKSINWGSDEWAGGLETEEDMYYALMLRATKRLVATAVSVLEVIEDPVWTLNISESLIASQLMSPSALRPILCSRAKELARMTQLWSPAVALSYCLVTHHDLHMAMQAEEELCTMRRPPEVLNSNEVSGVMDGSIVEPLLSQSSSYVEEDTTAAVVSSPEPLGKSQEQQEQGGITQNAEDSGPTVVKVGRSVSLLSSIRSSVPQQQQQQQPNGVATKDLSSVRWPFPERVPPTLTMANSIVMTCMILCAGPLSQHTVIALGQWCLRSLGALSATPCAVGLTHLMLKYPQFLNKALLRLPLSSSFPSSSSSSSATAAAAAASSFNNNQVPTLFCSAIFREGCRLANKVMQRQAKLRSDGRLTMFWQSDGGQTVGEISTSAYKETHHADKDVILNDLYEVQCYLVMMLQALEMRSGTQLSTGAQDELVSLFVTTSRLRIMVSTSKQQEHVLKHENYLGNNGTEPTLSQLVVQLVDESFRAVARAVDIILHDYDAGCPRRLCESLVQLLPPSSTLFTELERVGAWEKHLDCLETVRAAAEAYQEALRPLSSSSSSSSSFMSMPPPSPLNNAKTVSRLSLLDLQEELVAQAKLNAGVTRSSAEVMFGSLISVLPSSGEPLRLSAAPDGGLTLAQRQWWTQHMIVYLVEEWWCSRVTLPGQFHFFGMDCDDNNSSALPAPKMQRSFIQCCAHSI